MTWGVNASLELSQLRAMRMGIIEARQLESTTPTFAGRLMQKMMHRSASNSSLHSPKSTPRNRWATQRSGSRVGESSSPRSPQLTSSEPIGNFKRVERSKERSSTAPQQQLPAFESIGSSSSTVETSDNTPG